MKRILCGLLALCLLWAPRARAAEERTLAYEETAAGVRLTLEGPKEEIYALQLELVLEGEYPEAVFRPESRGVYCPDCHVEAGRRETAVTVYLVAEGEPLEGKRLTLGTLEIPGRPEMPARGELLLLDRNLRPLAEGRISLSREGGSASGSLSRVHIVQPENGTVTVRPTGAREGETVTLSAVPDAGYVLETMIARDTQDREVSLTRAGLNRYTFSMPAPDVEVTAFFAPGGELSFQEIGELFQKSEHWACVTYHRAKGMVQERLGEK